MSSVLFSKNFLRFYILNFVGNNIKYENEIASGIFHDNSFAKYQKNFQQFLL